VQKTDGAPLAENARLGRGGGGGKSVSALSPNPQDKGIERMSEFPADGRLRHPSLRLWLEHPARIPGGIGTGLTSAVGRRSYFGKRLF